MGSEKAALSDKVTLEKREPVEGFGLTVSYSIYFNQLV